MYFPLRGSQTTIWLFGSKPVCMLGFYIHLIGRGVYIKQVIEFTLECKVIDFEAFVGASVAGYNRRITDEGVVDTRVRDQVGLELVEIDIQSTVEAQARCDGADNLSDKAVEMFITGSRDVQVAVADVVDRFVVNEEGAVGVFDSAVGGENGVIRLDNSGGDTRSRVDCEFELGLFAVIRGQTLQEESTETGTGAAAKGVEDQKSLEGRAVVYCKSFLVPGLFKQESICTISMHI